MTDTSHFSNVFFLIFFRSFYSFEREVCSSIRLAFIQPFVLKILLRIQTVINLRVGNLICILSVVTSMYPNIHVFPV